MNRVTTVHPVGSVNRGISRGRREVEAETPKVLGEDPNARGGTSWSAWRAGPPSEQLTVGIEDELMLLDPRDWSLAFRSDELIPDLPSDLCGRVTLETYAAVMEIATGVHRRVAEAAAELADLRARLAGALGAPRAATRRRGHSPVRGMERHGGLVPIRATGTSPTRRACSPGGSRRSRCTSTSGSPGPRPRFG